MYSSSNKNKKIKKKNIMPIQNLCTVILVSLQEDLSNYTICQLPRTDVLEP